eukprot:scaffold1499_cov255-Pinguiococcus_pyrenoidosus.AAC.9
MLPGANGSCSSVLHGTGASRVHTSKVYRRSQCDPDLKLEAAPSPSRASKASVSLSSPSKYSSGWITSEEPSLVRKTSTADMTEAAARHARTLQRLVSMSSPDRLTARLRISAVHERSFRRSPLNPSSFEVARALTLETHSNARQETT